MSITGHEGGLPTRVGSSIGDLGAGLFTTIGILTALHHREKQGQSMMIDVAMLDSQVALLENAVTRYFASGEPPKPLGARHSSIAPFEPYRTRDNYIVIACGNDELFRKLCLTLGCPGVALDARFSKNAKRSEHVLLLKATLEDLLVHYPTQHWLDLLLPAGIPCAPINDVGQAVHDPQIQARHMVLPVDDPSVAPLMVAGLPIKMSAFADAERRPAAPDLDADRASILADFP
jgi:CoA:oxalate CoA-transferase